MGSRVLSDVAPNVHVSHSSEVDRRASHSGGTNLNHNNNNNSPSNSSNSSPNGEHNCTTCIGTISNSKTNEDNESFSLKISVSDPPTAIVDAFGSHQRAI